MTIPKRAIEKAIQGGWSPMDEHFTHWEQSEASDTYGFAFVPDKLQDLHFFTFEQIMCDNAFWQSLGKALGWADTDINKQEVWRVTAHRFYDLILTYGDTDVFWAEIIPDEK